jgi:hypothetical protein
VYENKGRDDNLPDTKDDIYAQLNAILHRNARILQKPSTSLSQFERWRTKPSLQNVETRGKGTAFPHQAAEPQAGPEGPNRNLDNQRTNRANKRRGGSRTAPTPYYQGPSFSEAIEYNTSWRAAAHLQPAQAQ